MFLVTGITPSISATFTALRHLTTTLVATRAVALGWTVKKAGFIEAIINGFAIAAPAVEEAAKPATPFPPPINRSASTKRTPVTITTDTPRKIPNKPVSMITFKSIVFPSAKPKNGISVCDARPKNPRRSGSRLPRTNPTTNASKASVERLRWTPSVGQREREN
jgi:hypothetical protein